MPTWVGLYHHTSLSTTPHRGQEDALGAKPLPDCDYIEPDADALISKLSLWLNELTYPIQSTADQRLRVENIYKVVAISMSFDHSHVP